MTTVSVAGRHCSVATSDEYRPARRPRSAKFAFITTVDAANEAIVIHCCFRESFLFSHVAGQPVVESADSHH